MTCLLIERDPDLVERLRSDLSTSPGSPPTPVRSSSLDAAGMALVDVAVAATGDDEDNLVISLLAKQEFAVPRVVARVNHPEQPVAVQRVVGRRHLGVDAAAAHGAGRGGRLGRLARPAAAVRARQRPPRRGHAGRRLARGRGHRSSISSSHATPRWWRWSARDRLVVPRGDTVLDRRGRGHGARDRRGREGRPTTRRD